MHVDICMCFVFFFSSRRNPLLLTLKCLNRKKSRLSSIGDKISKHPLSTVAGLHNKKGLSDEVTYSEKLNLQEHKSNSIDNFTLKELQMKEFVIQVLEDFIICWSRKSTIIRAFLLYSGNPIAFKLSSIFPLYLMVDYEVIRV